MEIRFTLFYHRVGIDLLHILQTGLSDRLGYTLLVGLTNPSQFLDITSCTVSQVIVVHEERLTY